MEYWGDVMLAGDEHLTDSAQACCAACAATRGCNTFVWCAADNAGCARQCWLKWQPDPRVPEVRLRTRANASARWCTCVTIVLHVRGSKVS